VAINILCLLALGLLHLLGVELELLTLKDVSRHASALTRARRDASVQTTSGELLVKVTVKLAGFLRYTKRDNNELATKSKAGDCPTRTLRETVGGAYGRE